MNAIDFENAYYIKLGRGGKWESSSIGKKKLRLGWGGQTIEDINKERWAKIKRQLLKEHPEQGVATRDTNALRWIAESTEKDIWITFHSCRLWWCRLGRRGMYEDKISKYRKLNSPWSDQDVDGNHTVVIRIVGVPDDKGGRQDITVDRTTAN